MARDNFFISYSLHDKAWAHGFAAALKKRGLSVSLFEEKARLGGSWPNALRRALRGADYFVPLIDPKGRGRAALFFEMGMAASLGKKVLLVVPQHLDASSLPVQLSSARVIERSTPSASASRFVEALGDEHFRSTAAVAPDA